MRIALATSEELAELEPDDAPLRAALGSAAHPAVWSDPAVDWASFDVILIRTVWDYFLRHDEFLAWLDRIDGLPVLNPVATLRWNSEKGYLRDLEGEGIATIPTAWDGEVPWEDAIVKPRVAGGSLGLRRARRGDPIPPGHLAQPFLPEVADQGELSLVFFDGEFSHAVRKTPARGDIRVQPEYGSKVEPADPTPAEHEAARAALEAAAQHPAGRDLLYARVDLVADGLLIELEAIEPRLFFSHAPPEAPERLVRALRARCASLSHVGPSAR